MSTYRYARNSRTPAQRQAVEWQRKVDEKQRLLAMFDQQIAAGRKLSDYDQRRQNTTRKALDELMDENPNEPV